jgi:acyl-coenzyme A synthetase/AMP-(fatty) acid ligase
MAFIILHPRHVETWKGRHEEFTKELKAHGRKTLPGFACPEWVQIVDQLPVSLSFPQIVSRCHIHRLHRKHPLERS